MKLFELPTQESAEALCKLLPAALRIVEDPTISEALAAFNAETSTAPGLFVLRCCSSIAPVLLQQRFDDTVTVLSAFIGKTEETIKAQPALETLNDIRECLNMDVLDFFTQSARADC